MPQQGQHRMARPRERSCRAFVCALLAVMACRGEIIDRVAVAIGDYQVITESAILREIRFTAFQNREPADFGGPSKRAAAERLVERGLILKEIEISRYPAAPDEDIEQMFRDTISGYPNEAAFRAALAKYGISEKALRAHLTRQLQIVRFIDYRFRPGVQIKEEDIREYYRREVLPKIAFAGKGPPPSIAPTVEVPVEARNKIERLLAAEESDRLLEVWLQETRARTRIEYREGAFLGEAP
ncbi:MAG: hypothetical protein WD696_20140 [Bryobacteraceae bacterium]